MINFIKGGINKKLIFLFGIFNLFFFSCSKEDNANLKVSILNEKIDVVFNKKDFVVTNFLKENKKVENLNKIFFKIENTSNFNYIFNPISNDIKKGNNTLASFPKLFTGISLNNFIIKTVSGETLDYENLVLGGDSICDDDKEDEISQYFKKQGYELNSYESLFKGLSLESLIIIPKKTSLYFESYISLPYNLPSQSIANLETVKLNSNEKYTIQMVFSADEEIVEKRLPKNLIRTIKEGSFKIFNGSIYSNKIPIIISSE